MTYEIKIYGGGGDYGFALMDGDNQKNLKLLKELGKLGLENDWDNYDDDFIEELEEEYNIEPFMINYYENKYQILYARGPETDDAIIEIMECKNDDEDCEEGEKFLSAPLKETPINLFRYEPFVKQINQFRKETSDDAIFFGGGYYSKRTECYNIIIKLDDNEKFDTNNLYIGFTDLSLIDEELVDIKIISKILYIPKKQKELIAKLYGIKEDDLRNKLHRIYERLDELKEIKEILNECECDFYTYVGGGVGYVTIKDKDLELIYQGEEYL